MMRQSVLSICLGLLALTFFAFGPALVCDFVNYDDNQYVYENPHIANGLTAEGVRRVFTKPHSSNWHPLTSLSHMLDCQLYGLQPFGHHLTSLALHAATVIALFLMLRSTTGALWRSALVAALFAVHPLRVESVVWISERKDVLSGLFFVLTLWAYTHYARHSFSIWRYLAVLAFAALGMLSKPMLVTLPCVLLLMDYWPLRRVKLLEKIPFFILSAALCVMTLWAQQEAVAPVESYSALWRLGNAMVSYATYIRQLFLPLGLTVLYPAQPLPPWSVIASFFLLAGISLLAVRKRKTNPAFLTGWLWYLGMLIPVIGLLQVGGQAHADRYTYLPHIGLLIALIWSVKSRWIMILPVVALVFATRAQIPYWQNGRTLWTRALSCTQNNFIAHSNLGTMLFEDDETTEAIAHFEKALQLEPAQPQVFNNLAVAYAELGRYADAVRAAQRALYYGKDRLEPGILNDIRARLKTFQTLEKTKP